MIDPAAATSTDLPALLADRYEVGELLGAGGMARVHRGHDRVLDRPVAIKLLDPSSAGDSKFLALFAREARSAAGLVHPNAVTVFDTGVDGENHFIVMELVEGGTLRDRIMADGPMEPERARRSAVDIARALTAAHNLGLVHRDVKPGNVLIATDGRLKVADFGIAHAVEDETTHGGEVLGTASYLAPEQARGEPTTPASDVYSLGCVLYEMIAGHPPFTGDQPVAVAAKHLHQAPVPIQSLRPSVPPALAAVVERALRKSPDERFTDGGDLLAALEGAATTTGLPPRLPATHRPQRRPLRIAAWAAALAAVTLLAVFGPALLRSGPSDPAQPADASEPVARTKVPDVRGMTEDEAGERLRKTGLVPVFRGGAFGDGIQSIVASQDPDPGTRVLEESFVTMELVPPSDEPEETEKDPGRSGRSSGGDDTGQSDEGSGGSGSGNSGGGSGDATTSPSPSPSPSPTPTPSPEAITEA